MTIRPIPVGVGDLVFDTDAAGEAGAPLVLMLPVTM